LFRSLGPSAWRIAAAKPLRLAIAAKCEPQNAFFCFWTSKMTIF